MHNPDTAAVEKPQKNYGLQPESFLAVGAQVMLTINLWAPGRRWVCATERWGRSATLWREGAEDEESPH